MSEPAPADDLGAFIQRGPILVQLSFATHRFMTLGGSAIARGVVAGPFVFATRSAS